jgi:SAM-dependent methyltransferase
LEIGCGVGSHALVLSKRGFDVTGIDISQAMLDEAERRSKEEKEEIRFELQDMRSLDLGTVFDSAICLFGTFGYLKQPKDIQSFLQRLRVHLRDKGLFIFEFWNTKAVMPDRKDWITRTEGASTLIRLSRSLFDLESNVLSIVMRYLIIEDSKVVQDSEELHKVRTFTIPEIRHLVEENGFELLDAFSGERPEKELEKPSMDTVRVLAVARTVQEKG